MGFGIKLISIVSGVMLLASCSSTRSVSRHQSMPERDRFFDHGISEISVRTGVADKRSFMNILHSVSDDIITGDYYSTTLRSSPDSISFLSWIPVRSPRIIPVRDVRGEEVMQVYMEPRYSLGVTKGVDSSPTEFSGDMARINRELYAAPRFDFDAYDRAFEVDSVISYDEAMTVCRDIEADYNKKLDEYVAANDLLPKSVGILRATPLYGTARWMLENERRIGITEISPMEVYAPVKRIFDNEKAILSQLYPANIVRALTGSIMLDRMARMQMTWRKTDYVDAVLEYAKRYRGLAEMAGKDTIPLIGQVALGRALCAGGMLKRAGSLDDALRIVDSVGHGYITDPVIMENVRRYCRRIYGEKGYDLSEEDAAFLRQLFSQYRGKTLILDFWGYYCPPCRREIEKGGELRRQANATGDVAIVFVTDPWVTDRALYDKYTSEHMQSDYTHYLDRRDYARLEGMFIVGVIPRHVVIDADMGRVIDIDFDMDKLTELLWTIKAKKEADIPR